MVRIASALFVGLLLILSAPAGHAQPTESDLQLAKQHFNLGKTYYEQADYERALASFQQSYRLSERAALLYNIGKCYEALGKLDPAITNYRRYLSETGKSDATIAARIRNLEARLARERRARKPAAPAPTPAPTPVAPVAPSSAPAVTAAPPMAAPAPAPSTAPPEETAPGGQPSSWMKWTGWSLVGVGAVSIAASIFLGTRAAAKASALEDAYVCSTATTPPDSCGNVRTPYEWSQLSDIESRGKAFELGQIVTLVVGIVAAGSGTALLLFAPSAQESETRTARVSPMLTNETVGFTGGISF